MLIIELIYQKLEQESKWQHLREIGRGAAALPAEVLDALLLHQSLNAADQVLKEGLQHVLPSALDDMLLKVGNEG